MLSMANANRFIRMGAIPLVVVAYAVFLWIDHGLIRHPDIKIHMQNIKNIGGVDGLVFGGSNAIYSLSAETLSNFTGVKWYNASVTAELNNIRKHKNFIEDFSARIDRMKVRYVVYSTLLPYEIGKIAVLESDKSEKKIESIRIKPKNSVLADIKSLKSRNEGPRRNGYGDIVFDERVRCDFSDSHATHEDGAEREDIDIAVDFLVDMANFFYSVFPYASIYIVLPSEYYGRLSVDDLIFGQTLRTKFYDFLPVTNSMVKIIFQPPYSSIAQVCFLAGTADAHANEDGRLWRTRNLIEFMVDTLQQQISIRSSSAAWRR